MPDIDMAAIIFAIIGAAGGLSGVAALLKTLSEFRNQTMSTNTLARKTEVDMLASVVDRVEADNARLQERLRMIQCQVDALSARVKRYRDGIRLLLQQLEERGIEPVWHPDDDDIEA